MSWEGKKVLVLGAGESGLAMARHLAGAGASLRVADTRDNPPGAQALREAAPEAELVWGPFAAALFEGVDAVAVSPGVPVSGPLADAAVLEAKAGGLSFVGDIELFALALADEKAASGYAPKILAITGTNGKTTVTALTAYLANRAGKRATAAGNISPAALDAWHAAKAGGSLPDIWVLELSSYQLETTSSLVPDAAVMLNLSEDHLDRHGSMAGYAAAKARIFAAGGLQILNRDDPASLAMRRPFVPKGKKDAPPVVVTFGSSEPQSEHEYGLAKEARPGGLTWLAEGTEDGPKRLMPVEVLKIKGLHNALNALAALALNRGIGLSLAPMLKALADYAGEAHRVQPVAEVAGVTYIDDSKGTNVGATLAALSGLGSELRNGRKLVLIAGGDGKGQNFEPLAVPVAVYCRAVMLIGRDGPAIGEALGDGGVPLTRCEGLPQAVQAASRAAQPGDIVLLSPACASLDMFRNYAHRAEVFVEAVRGLGRGDVAGDAAADAVDAGADSVVADAVATEPPAIEEVAAGPPASGELPVAEASASVAPEVPVMVSIALEQVSAPAESAALEPVVPPVPVLAPATQPEPAAPAVTPMEPASPPSDVGEPMSAPADETGDPLPASSVEPVSPGAEQTADVRPDTGTAPEPATPPSAPAADADEAVDGHPNDEPRQEPPQGGHHA
jgi:UDP-N-acetylmuramoylalanine--D-glutamate ligase